MQSWLRSPQIIPENRKCHAQLRSLLIRKTILLVLLLIRALLHHSAAFTCTFFSSIMAAFILLSNCLSYLSLWLFVSTSRSYHLTCAAIHQCHANHNTSARILQGMPWATAFLMVPVGLAHSAIWVALWKLLLVFTHWHLLGRQASCVSPCAVRHCNPDSWF